MKSLALFALTCGVLAAQVAVPPAGTLPNVPDETVIAVFDDGTKLTMGEFKAYYGVLPQNSQQSIMRFSWRILSSVCTLIPINVKRFISLRLGFGWQ